MAVHAPWVILDAIFGHCVNAGVHLEFGLGLAVLAKEKRQAMRMHGPKGHVQNGSVIFEYRFFH